MPGPDRNYDGKNLDRIRRLRAEMSESERRLYAKIRDKKLGYKFRRQYPIGPFVLDLYCPKLKLCIEVDGEQHLRTKDKDARRDAYVSTFGILTIRIPSMELFGENEMGSEAWSINLKEICDTRWREFYPDLEPPSRKYLEG